MEKKGSPSEVLKEAEIYYTEYGKLRVKILAQKIERFEEPHPIIRFSEGIKAIFYNDSAEVISTLTAVSATMDEQNQMMMAENNVELISKENEKLNTEQLILDEKTNKIFTDKLVRISTADEMIIGEGFESTTAFSSYKITNVKGTINLKESTK